MIADTFSKEVHVYKVGDHENNLHPIILVEPCDDVKESTPISLYIRNWSDKPENLHFNVLNKVKNDATKNKNIMHEDAIEEVSSG